MGEIQTTVNHTRDAKDASDFLAPKQAAPAKKMQDLARQHRLLIDSRGESKFLSKIERLLFLEMARFLTEVVMTIRKDSYYIQKLRAVVKNNSTSHKPLYDDAR